MKNIHRITLNVDKKIKHQLNELEIDVEIGFDAFKIDEASNVWEKLKLLMKNWDVGDTIYTKFSKSELKKADFLAMLPSWHCGYPMPDDDFGYLQTSYDLSNYSEESGIGAIQNSSLRMKNKPKWGKKHITQLHWIYDIYFVKLEVYEEIFKPLNIKSMPVIEHKTNNYFDDFVQIIPQKEVSLNLSEYPYQKYETSEMLKYLPITHGFFPSLKESSANHYNITKEYFGSGASANKAIIISNDLYTSIIKNKLKGVSFVPLKDVKE